MVRQPSVGAVAALAWVCVAILGERLPAQGIDALGVPRITAPDLVSQPAGAASGGWSWHVAVLEPSVGVGLFEQRAGLQRATPRWVTGVRVGRQSSAIHTRLDTGLFVQLRGHAGAIGVAADGRHWSFRGHAVQRRWHLRFGARARITRRDAAQLQFAPAAGARDAPEIIVQVSTSRFTPWVLVFQERRVAGLPALRHWGVVWGGDAFALAGGIEIETATVSAGVGIGFGATRWETGVRQHPLLGWGRASSLRWSY